MVSSGFRSIDAPITMASWPAARSQTSTALPLRTRSSIMRHFNIAEYIRRSMSRFDGEDPLPLAGRAEGDGSGLFAVVLPRLDALDRFFLFVTTVSYTHLRAHETRHDLVC